ncbi:MAG: enoyl-CoA hydratase [Rhodospirillaceae bacterium]|jgi:2-(1,2-epoxy-1,2-dihydrophenyl)acetyl-CoA isomerase|nr:enoyl-CoA hydratase [Rhodospirillaceae bacterium]
MAYEALIFELSDGVARITMNRPEAGNALNDAMGKELLDVAIRCSEDQDVRAVLLTGAGKNFGFGGDLKHFSDNKDTIGHVLKELTTYFHGAVARFQHMEAPLVVAVNGMAAGAGFSKALIGDIVIAGESAQFKMAYTAAGLIPDGTSTYYLPRMVGLRRAQELMITNRTLSAAEALDWGVVTTVVPDAALMDEANALATRLAAGPTKAYGMVKRLLSRTFEQTLETQMEDESRMIAAAAKSEDGREGLDAFLNKRKPVFKGR